MDGVLFTLGYGGGDPAEFSALLVEAGVRTVVDVRARPDRASMGAYVRAKDRAKGIEGLLARSGIGYVSLPELGNPFLDPAFAQDWQRRYGELLRAAGPLLTERLQALVTTGAGGPFCLMCAERDPAQCHRTQIAAQFPPRGVTVRHLGVRA